MIDTDKYEGHNLDDAYTECCGQDSKKDWCVMNLNASACFNGICNMHKPTAQLIADAPLLLEEVKRLREWIEQAVDVWENCNHEDRTDWFNNFCEVMKND